VTDRIPLSLLPRELIRFGGPAVSYRAAYNLVLDGRLPAERGEAGRWSVARDDLPAIAETLRGGARPPVAALAQAAA
jgi:hypothetical protein